MNSYGNFSDSRAPTILMVLGLACALTAPADSRCVNADVLDEGQEQQLFVQRDPASPKDQDLARRFRNTVKARAVNISRKGVTTAVISTKGSLILRFSKTRSIPIDASSAIVGFFKSNDRIVGIRILAQSQSRETLDSIVPVNIARWYASPFECSIALWSYRRAYLDVWLDPRVPPWASLSRATNIL